MDDETETIGSAHGESPPSPPEETPTQRPSILNSGRSSSRGNIIHDSSRRRPRSSRITFSFLHSINNSITSAKSHASSDESRRNSMQETIMAELNADMIDEELNDETYDGINRRVSQESVTSSGSIRSDSGTGLALKRLFSKKGNIEQKEGGSLKPQSSSLHRRYGRGDHVLITNHDLPDSSLKLVNLHGFAEWDAGEALTSEEGRGPYSYLLAEVKNIHFQENLPYYTVTRIDTGEDQRADVDCMEPITNERNIEAARRAASKRQRGNPGIDRYKGIKTRLQRRLNKLDNRRKRIQKRIKKQLDACLNGNRPYSCTCRFTGVNLLVFCSIWFLYVDQLRLVYVSNKMDPPFAMVSFIVWLILVLELIFEVYIRPPDYYSMIKSENAYLPSNARFISNFHVCTESIALAFFVPEFICLFEGKSCGSIIGFSLPRSCLKALYGPDKLQAFYGQAFLCMMALRIFGLVRHWENMWINNTFVRIKGRDGVWSIKRSRGLIIPQGRLPREKQNAKPITESILIKETAHSAESEELLPLTISTVGLSEKQESSDEIHLTNASKIGTALLTTNAQRGLIIVFLIGLQSLVATIFEYKGGTNQQVWTSVELLQENNIATNASDEDSCEYLNGTVYSWVAENLIEHGRTDDELYLHLISVVIRPARCAWQTGMGSWLIWEELCLNELYACADILSVDGCKEFCTVWPTYDPEQLYDYAMRHFDIRPSMTVSTKSLGYGPYILQNGTVIETEYYVEAVFNERLSVESSILSLFFLQLGLTVFILLALSVIRYDAGRLVLNPLRRMLKIVAAYSKNPLAPPPQKTSSFRDRQKSSDKLGTFETEQLINTVTKITDLLRKCWGTAGADIISSNLARQEGGLSKIASYNPTVPGKAVYALFAFVAIDNYKSYLHNLQGDIIILINDVAAILHEEVYRWGYEDKGQCNKNLGSAFLMVYKIGEVNEVLENRKKAEQVIFSSVNTPAVRRKFTHRRVGSMGSRSNSTGSSKSQHPRNRSSVMVDNIDLSSLPGIQAFADRALLGLLKTFAGIHRDRTILKWNEDFRIGSSVELFFGMDAGWAVEGAVGSSYKIDATYLSPHVNMASRMMSATKQYGLFLLISEKVESLLSPGGQKSLRHIDTVTVKGSSLQQKIFTFDMKVRNDFFLYSKSENQADLDSERYSPAIWSTDQDLCAMRNHISDDFLVAFNKGRDEYLSGRDWKKAIEYLKHADKIMCKREVDEGYSESTENIREHMYSLTNVFDRGTSFSDSEECRRRLQMGDGPCQRLIEFMLEHRGEAPPDWEGYRPLTSK